MITREEFKTRRRRVMKEIGAEAVFVLPAAQETLLNYEKLHRFQQDKDFHYLTGFDEPEALAVLLPGRAEGEYVLLNRVRDPAQELWMGKHAGQEGARRDFDADQAFAIGEADTLMPTLLAGRRQVYFPFGESDAFDARMVRWVNAVRGKARVGALAPTDFIYSGKPLHAMRRIKSAGEIAAMRRAAEISAAAHRRALQACRPGMNECEIVAELVYEFLRGGGEAAYPPIVAGGANACVLHYMTCRDALKPDDLLLIDAAARYQGYAADVTRTFPVNGHFTPEQRAIYQLVLDTQIAVIAAVRPGLSWEALQKISERVVTGGLIKLGLLQGDLETLLARRAFYAFYMHRIGHWIGLDTHDRGDYHGRGRDEVWATLEPGMVFTVEPGIYIAADSEGVDKKWWNIGVRIEDDVVVTEDGCEVLTAAIPKAIGEIEREMAAR